MAFLNILWRFLIICICIIIACSISDAAPGKRVIGKLQTRPKSTFFAKLTSDHHDEKTTPKVLESSSEDASNVSPSVIDLHCKSDSRFCLGTFIIDYDSPQIPEKDVSSQDQDEMNTATNNDNDNNSDSDYCMTEDFEESDYDYNIDDWNYIDTSDSEFNGYPEESFDDDEEKLSGSESFDDEKNSSDSESFDDEKNSSDSESFDDEENSSGSESFDESDYWARDYPKVEDQISHDECDYCGGENCSFEDCCNYPSIE